MKNLFTLLSIGSFVLLLACKDDEPEIDPLVGIWELDEATLEVSGYSYYGFEGENDLYGESSYVIEFRDDNTYEREINDIPQGGGSIDHSDEGEWESDGEQVDLDSEDDEVGGVAYVFTIVEVDDSNLIVTYTETQNVFPDNKIEEWFDDGTLTSSGFFDVTQEEYDSLVTNFRVQTEGVITLEFDKED